MINTALYSVLLFTALLLLGISAARARQRRRNSSLDITHLTGFRDIRALLAPPSTPLPILLAQRAAPNARLIRAFGISNTFVSADVDVHAAFTRAARALIAGNDWDRFAQCARLALDHGLGERTEHSAIMRYDTFMQNVSLLSILAGLFEVSFEDVTIADLSIVARGINDLWKLSKTTDTLPPHMLSDINTRLRAWIPAQPNPVDFIIPAFETMWRVVAITVAYTHADPLARTVLHIFLTDPTAAAFTRSDSDTPSVEALITETIRLHPPTRRISRHVTAGSTQVAVADIGALHRDKGIWGADADVYNATRHQHRTPEQAQALLGFGAGTLKCVASRWAPHAAGIIVATIADRIADGIEIVEGKGIGTGGRDGWEGWSVECVECA